MERMGKVAKNDPPAKWNAGHRNDPKQGKPSSVQNAHPMMAPPTSAPRKYPLPPPTLVTYFTLFLPIHARPLQVTQSSDIDLFMFQDNNAWEDIKIDTDEKRKTYWDQFKDPSNP